MKGKQTHGIHPSFQEMLLQIRQYMYTSTGEEEECISLYTWQIKKYKVCAHILCCVAELTDGWTEQVASPLHPGWRGAIIWLHLLHLLLSPDWPHLELQDGERSPQHHQSRTTLCIF